MSETLRCLEHNDQCQGPVEMRWPGYGEKLWPRCQYHGDKRVETQQGIDERYPPNPPSDWSPLDAGESWYEED